MNGAIDDEAANAKRIAELEADARRLDWIEKNTTPYSYGGMLIAITEGLWEIGEASGGGFNGWSDGEGGSLRKAIDDAMSNVVEEADS